MDPFAAFGDDDDDDDIDDAVNDSSSTSRAVAQSLVDQVNRKQGHRQEETTTPSQSVPLVPTWTPPSTWPKPLYMHPDVVIAQDLPPMGRGLVCCARDLTPGTLVLVEEPMMTWENSSDSPLNLAETDFDVLSGLEQILKHPKRGAIVKAMEGLHPTKQDMEAAASNSCTLVDPVLQEQITSRLTKLRAQYAEDDRFHECVRLVKTLLPDDNDSSTLRLLLVLRYNALQGGLFLYAAMLNHGEPSPNCIKFKEAADRITNNTRSYSEVRVLRHIPACTALTISYLPTLMAHASRRHYLWQQHYFDIGTPHANSRMERVHGSIPESALEVTAGASTTGRIERALAEMKLLLRDATSWDEVIAIELATDELCQATASQLGNDEHILLLPCRHLHTEACHKLLEHPHSSSRQQRSIVLQRLIVSCQHLNTLQSLFYSADGVDRATTNQDLAAAIQEWIGLGGSTTNTTSENWPAIAATAQKEYQRISALYPYNVEEMIANYKHG